MYLLLIEINLLCLLSTKKKGYRIRAIPIYIVHINRYTNITYFTFQQFIDLKANFTFDELIDLWNVHFTFYPVIDLNGLFYISLINRIKGGYLYIVQFNRIRGIFTHFPN